MKEECELIHGIPCEAEDLVLPPEVDDALPAGDLLELGSLSTLLEDDLPVLAWKDQDGEVRFHEFQEVKVYAAGSGVIYLVGDFQLTEQGLVNG